MIDFFLIVGAFALGGILKGATGAGAPIIAVPVIAVLYDVQTAVTVFAIPNLVSNGWQAWKYRANRLPPLLTWQYVLSGAIGAAAGTIALKRFSTDSLGLIVAVTVFLYIVFRLLKPDWTLSRALATLLASPAGMAAGMLQGASGVSAPVSLTFLNAMKLPREQFIVTISLSFVAMALIQLPLMLHFGLMTTERFHFGLLALIPLFAFMPVGARLAERVSPLVFDRAILILLAAIAAKLAVNSASSFL